MGGITVKRAEKYSMACSAVSSLKRYNNGLLCDSEMVPLGTKEIEEATGFTVYYLVKHNIISKAGHRNMYMVNKEGFNE
jgi:hypothetical protein